MVILAPGMRSVARTGLVLVTTVALVIGTTLTGPPPAFAGTTYQAVSDPTPIRNRPLFDSQGTATWPAASDFARDAGSRYQPLTRGLTGFTAGPGYAYGKGTTRFGWAYELPAGGFGNCNPTQPSGATTPIGGGYVRVVGEGEQHVLGSTNSSITLYVNFKNHECGPAQANISQTTIQTWPHQPSWGTRTRKSFDATVAIPAGARQIQLVVGSPQGSLRLFSFRMYATGPGQPPPTLPGEDLVPDAQLLGLGTGLHGVGLARYESDPVNTAIGNYAYMATDFRLPGRGLPLDFTRTYNSLDTATGSIGVGWRHSFGARLVFEAGGVVRFVAEDGAQYVYAPNGSGGYVTPRATFSRLSAVGDGTYLLTRRDQVSYHFDAAGYLLSQADRNGNTISLGYSSGQLTSITDTVGRSLTLAYDGEELISVSAPPNREVTYTYDAAGRLATATDATDGLWTYGYDGSDRLTTITDPNNHVLVRNTYGANGRVDSQTNAKDQTGTFAWNPTTETSTYTDARGKVWTDIYRGNVLEAKSDPLGNTTFYGYDTALNLNAVRDPRGNTTTFTYDAAGNMLTRKAPAPLAYTETWTYTSRNDVATYVDGRSKTTTYDYDTAGNLIQVSAPLNAATEFARDPAGTGLLLSMTDPRDKVTSYTYDADSNVESITTPAGNTTTMDYDAAGRMTSLVDPRGNAPGANAADFMTTFTYDAADRLETTTDPLSHVTDNDYDAVGNLVSVIDANSHVTTYGYDDANRLLTVTDELDGVTAYAYDAVGNLTTRTDANTHLTTYAYDDANRLVTTTDPLDHEWALTYDANGNIATRTDASLKTTTYAYDKVDRLTGITYAMASTPAVTLAYDANDNLTTMTDGAGTETRTYDDLNRLATATRGADTFSYGYDLAGNITTRTYPGQSAQVWTYDDDGRLSTANGTTYAYDEAGNPLTAAGSDGVTATYTYDRAGRLLEVAHVTATETLSRFTYALDAMGNRIAMTTREGTVTYRYDGLNRLTQACWSRTTCPGGVPATPLVCIACVGGLITRPSATVTPPPGETFRTYSYDPVGNRLTEASDAGTTTYAYDPADRLTSITPPGQSAVSYGYDANGNQTSAGATTYTFDLADRLKTATVGSTTETYAYAGDGTRLSASTGAAASATTKFLWDRAFGLPQLAVERDGAGGLLRSYRHGLELVSQIAGSDAFFYHHDGLGSVVDVTGSSGSSLTWSEYYPNGFVRQGGAEATAPGVQPFAFAGEQLDAVSGLYHLRARQYDPATGRFLSTDPVSQLLTDPYTSAYAYARNNPALLTDPGGTCTPAAIPAAAVAGGGVLSVETTAAAVACMAVLWAVTALVAAPAIEQGLDSARPPYPESQPKWDPAPDPHTRRAMDALVDQLRGLGTGDQFPGAGLPGSNFCRQHPTACRVGLGAAVALAVLTGVLIFGADVVGASQGPPAIIK